MRILCVIPSRISSTRLKRKPLLDIQGKPMIQWVYEKAIQSSVLTDVIVATDCEEIAEVVKKIGGKAQLTDPDLPTGSDRVAAVAALHPDMDVIINLQGDEPFIKPHMLKQLVEPFLLGEKPDMTTLAYPLNRDRHQEPGSVKVITDIHGNALYFSRAPIPYFRTENKAPVYQHIGIYAFRRDFLLQYTNLPQTLLEKTESLEQLRALEHGFKIRVCLTEVATHEINTEKEYQEAQRIEGL